VLILVLIIGAIHYLFFKEFTFISFDPIMARTLGFNSGFWNLLIYFTIGATVAFTVKIAGVLLVFSFFVIPTVTSAMLANRMRIIFILSMVFGVLSTVLGLYLAFILDYPAGPTIVAVSGMFLGIAFLIHKFRRF
jgi:ABC-type Mn2+/Zn2+ transport system permease subunit